MLRDTRGFGAISHFLDRLGEGEGIEDAMREELRADYPRLESDLADWLKQPRALSVRGQAGAAWGSRRRPPRRRLRTGPRPSGADRERLGRGDERVGERRAGRMGAESAFHGLVPRRGGLAVAPGGARVERQKGDGGLQVGPAGEPAHAGIRRAACSSAARASRGRA